MSRAARKPAADPTIAVGAVRVSKDEQTLSPEAQRDAMERWCAAHGVTLAAVFEDIDVCGGAPLDKRAGLLAALDALRAHGAGLLLVAKRDRLSRDPILTAMVERLAERSGARLVSAAGEGTEDDGPASILMRRIVDAFAEYERALIRARTRDALAVKRSRGERVGGIPYGYRLADDGRALVADDAEREAIAAARELCAAGLSLRKIGEALAARGMAPRSGGRWHAETVKALLASEAA